MDRSNFDIITCKDCGLLHIVFTEAYHTELHANKRITELIKMMSKKHSSQGVKKI